MDLNGKKVLVIGCKKSGVAAARLLESEGAIPVLYDANAGLDAGKIREENGLGETIQMVLGDFPADLGADLALVVPSPGVPTDTGLVEQLSRQGIPVWGEVELAWRYGKGNVIAITGTNGKTTTTTLVGEILKAYRDSVFVVGNIGVPYTQEVPKMRDDSVTVAEISSFQLETAPTFHPAVSAILNITPDHLNRHHTMETYVAVKAAIAKNQGPEDFCVLNYEDSWLQGIAPRLRAQVIWFSSARKLERGYYLEGDQICRNLGQGPQRLLSVHDMNLIGVHNYENVMAAIAISAAFGVPMETILSVVRQFKAVEHRIEYVAEKKGVVYYNDSKGTNPDAAIRAIRAMDRPTVLIGGGYDKGSRYDEWVEAFLEKTKLLVLIGQTAEDIAACARQHGFTAIKMADTFEEAMDICVRSARPGDAVLLSPACASWGMFQNYEERGRMFKEYVNRLEG